MIPFSKYLCMNGYTHNIGMIVTIEIVYFMTFPFNADSRTVWLIPDVLPDDIRAARFEVVLR